jgi:hypothetical protein
MEWTFHGDPKRNQRFWVYPAKDNIITPQWDFRVNPCNNSKKLSGIFSSKDEYQCLGHHSSQVTIKKKGGELWKKVLIGVGIGIGVAAVGVAAAVVINEIMEQQKYTPCEKCKPILDAKMEDIFTNEDKKNMEALEVRYATLKSEHETCKCVHIEPVNTKI